MKLSLLVCFICVASGAMAGTSQDAARILATAPLRFEPASNGADRYLARGTRFRFEFSKNQALLRSGNKTIRLEFAGAARQAQMEGVGELRSKTAVFLGNDRRHWRTAIPNYGRLQVRGLYTGIDLVYYGNAGELEYDLKIKPGCDPGQIRLRLEGERARLDGQGNLVAELIQRRPVAYQTDPNGARVPVQSRYRRNGDGSYGFALGSYDRGRELVIDPVLTLSAYLSGSSADVAYAIGHDALGFEYVAGTTDSTDFPVTGDARQGAIGGAATDLFLVKIDPSAPAGSQVVYATYLGGALAETFGGMAVGPKGDVYLTGSTVSTDFPTLHPYQSSLTNAPGMDAFVVWIDSGQNLAYSTYLGGSSADAGNAIAVDSTGKVWVTGGTQSVDFPNIGGIQGGFAGAQDIFITGFDVTQTGGDTILYSSFLGGSRWDTGRGIAAAADGTLWVVGGTYSFDIAIVGSSYQHSYQGSGDAYIAHVNPAFGVDGLLYSTYLGGNGLEEARNVVLDPAGRVIVSGYTLSPNFPVTPDALQPRYGGNTDVFVSILAPANSPPSQLVYSTYFGGSNGDVAFDLKRDANGVLYLAGLTLSPELAAAATADSLQAAYDGSMDAFVLRFNPSRAGAAAIDYFSYLGSDGQQVGYGVDFDASGNVYVVGSSSGPIFDALAGAGKPTDPGNIDAFVLGFSSCTYTTSVLSAQFPQLGDSITITLTVPQSDCSWTSSSSLDWVTVSPASGSGNGSVTITAAANNTGAPRQGAINIAGVAFLVGQD